MLASPVDTEFLSSLLAEASGGATVGSASAGSGCTTQQFGNTSSQDGSVLPQMLLPDSPLPVLDQGVVSRRDGSTSAARLAAQDRSSATTPASSVKNHHPNHHHHHHPGSPIDLPTPSDLPEVITPWARSPSVKIETYTPTPPVPLRLTSDENHQHLSFSPPAGAPGQYPSLALTLNYEDWSCSDHEMFAADGTSSPPLTINTGFIVDKRSPHPQLQQPAATDLATPQHPSYWPTPIAALGQEITPQQHSPVWQSSGLDGVDVLSQRSSPLSSYFGPPTPVSPSGFPLPTGLMPTSYPSSGLEDHAAAGYSIGSSNNNSFLDQGGVIYSGQQQQQNQRQQVAALVTPPPHPPPQIQHTTLQSFLQRPNQSLETLMSNFPTLPSNRFPTSPSSNHGDPGAARDVYNGQQGQHSSQAAQLGGNNEEEDSQDEEPAVNGDEEEQSEQPYAKLLWRAFMSSPERTMTLQDVYRWFMANTDKVQSKGWQNSIRHNLSMNHAFTKLNPRLGKDSPAATSTSNQDDEGNRSKAGSTSSTAKKSAIWYLQDWAIENGVQSTTRYRNKTQTSSSSRSGGSKGGDGGTDRQQQQQQNSSRQSSSSSSSPMVVQNLRPVIGGSRRSNRTSSARWPRYSDRMHPYCMLPHHSVQQLEVRSSPHSIMSSLQSSPSAMDLRRQQQQGHVPVMITPQQQYARDQWQFTQHQNQHQHQNQQPSGLADPTGEMMYAGGPQFCYTQQQQQQHNHHHHHLDNMYPISGPPVRTEPLMTTHRPAASYDLSTSQHSAQEVTPQQQQMLPSSAPTTSYVPGVYDGVIHHRQAQQQSHDYQHQQQEVLPEIKMEDVAVNNNPHQLPFPNRGTTAAAATITTTAAATPSNVEPKPSPRQTSSGGLGGVFASH
ncbi:hypothetical protein PspLS_05109 [Pyricularia sp. CBS 133598]|nr:hypothetical protein PspLS_05109 [Pyricularia sp. CBS 133598]